MTYIKGVIIYDRLNRRQETSENKEKKKIIAKMSQKMTIHYFLIFSEF